MPASSTKTTVIKACTRVHHPLTEVVTIWRAWQRRRCSRCGLTQQRWDLMCDNVDAIATTVQHLRTAFRSDVQIEPPEEVPDNSDSIASVYTRKVERKFAVRNVTELMVDDGQQADRGRKTRLNDVDGLVRGDRSAGRIERLLRSKRCFGELWNQKGECAIPCDKQLCSFTTLREQESSQMRRMDRGEI